jgi:hypothetical protein
MLRWIVPSLVPMTMTSTALLSFGSNGRKMASKDGLELKASSLYSHQDSVLERTTLTYELPAVARTLSFGRLVSMSMRDKSLGKSKGVFSSEMIPSPAKNVLQDPAPWSALAELALFLVKFVAQPKHVIPDTLSQTVNWCTTLLLSAPTRRTDPSVQAIASSWPIHRLVFLLMKTSTGDQRAVWFPPNALNS